MTRMTESSPLNLNEPEWERGLWWMVGFSGCLHLVGVALLLLIPHTFLHHPPALHSYTVDLVAPDQVGGNNLIEGGKGRTQGAPMAAAPPVPEVEPPKPPPPKVEEPKPPEPQKAEPEKVAPKEVVQKPEPPKVEEKPKANEMALAEKVKTVQPPPPPTAAQAPPTPHAKPAPSPKVLAKAEAAKPQPKAPPKVDAKAEKAAAAARARDERIAAAIRRVEQQAGSRGAGTGQKAGEQPGGPVSVGPGEGSGGEIKGVEYLMFYNQMINGIKQRWAWPLNSTRSLEAVVRFSIAENGQITDVRITRASGDASFDASVERAVKAASPLPAPPEAYRKEFADVELTFTPEQLKM